MSFELQAAEEAFSQAIELPADQREGFVRRIFVDNEEACSEVLQLLQQHSDTNRDNFILDRPVVMADGDLALQGSDAIGAIGEKPGDIIGDYKLLERIGEGGMGVVYMAEQLMGVRKKVALKIIKPGMDTRQVVARFEVERQAMALFEHPNIARALDAGATEGGRPFFVMELVRGINISDYVEDGKLSLTERLNLFLSICNAVQHAHQKGIIHRDLKPSNILITQFDGIPVPKVIDFGIAKAVGQRLTEKTLFTRYSAMIGTPQYMSPEQAEMTGIDIDTRSDIYSLGVLLYELITGTTPLLKNDLKKLNPLALYETLRDTEIEPPSKRVTKTDLAQAEWRSNEEFDQRVQLELDWIVMKALSRDRKQRYASANELSAEVQRFLAGEPVLAVPPSRWYKFRNYANKHRATVATVGLVSLLLLASSIISSIFAYQAYRLNGKLTSTLGQATKNLERAETAEQELREANEAQLYDTAHSISFAKFNSEFYPELFDEASDYFELINGNNHRSEMENSDQKSTATELLLGDGNSDIEFYEMGFCIEYESALLLEGLDHDILAGPLARLKQSIDKEESFHRVLEQHFEEMEKDSEGHSNTRFESIGKGSGNHQHSEFCLQFQERTKEILPKYRVRFFRILVNEYRKTFGTDDPRVADGLALLAASLIEDKELNEAEARLREAISLKNGRDVTAEEQLLRRALLAK